ncbi:hypothetical protein TSAR_007196, partial [Trichomalopsis sarcophagae]
IEAEEELKNSLQENAQLPSSSPHDSQKAKDRSLTMTVDSSQQTRREVDLINLETPRGSTLHSFAPAHFATTAVTTTITSAPTGAHYSRSAGAQVTLTSTTLQGISRTSQNMDTPLVCTYLPSGDVQFIQVAVATEL